MPRPNVSEKRKQEILQAAAHVFTAQGLAVARMEDVAAAAGISKGTIYLYYPSKDSLIEALLRLLFKPLDDALAALLDGTDPARNRVQRYGESVILAFAEVAPLHPLILELFALSPRNPVAGELFKGYFISYRDGLAGLFRSAGEAGEVSLAAFDGDAYRASVSFMAMVEGLLLLALINPALIDLRRDGMDTLAGWLRQL